MNRSLFTLIVLLVASAVRAQEKPFDADGAIVDLQHSRKEMADLIKTIRTRADAERVAGKLAEQGDRIIAVEKALGRFEAKLSGREKKDYIETMTKKHLVKQKEINSGFARALVRLEIDLPDAYRVVKDNALFRQHREDNFASVRSTIAALDRNVKTYIESENRPPKSLKQVVESVYSTVGVEALQDPWGRPYQYDRDGKNNGGKKPDIWIVDPYDGKTRIGNWPKQ